MSEPEQDALLDRIERVRRRELLWSRARAGLVLGAVLAVLFGALYLAR